MQHNVVPECLTACDAFTDVNIVPLSDVTQTSVECLTACDAFKDIDIILLSDVTQWGCWMSHKL
jgi:hypothetical protein